MKAGEMGEKRTGWSNRQKHVWQEGEHKHILTFLSLWGLTWIYDTLPSSLTKPWPSQLTINLP